MQQVTVVKPTPQVIAGYMLTIAGAYHLGFWTWFPVKVFQFMSLSDFSRLAVWPGISFAGAHLSGLIGHAFINRSFPGLYDSQGSTPSARDEARTRVYMVLAAGLALVLCIVSVIMNSPIFWIIVSQAVAISLGVLLIPHIKIEGINVMGSGLTVMSSVIMIFGTWGYAASESTAIQLGSSFVRLDVDENNEYKLGLTKMDELRLVTNTEEYLIAQINDGPVIIAIPRSSLSHFRLTRIQRPVTYRPVIDWVHSLLSNP